ncbi:MAG TPA: toll/interleukin-1 receptor domain-containing protein, partial [Caldilineaceae bacterium]|nr:toll/interleukin-1 receptor domain-containing protein [Caldilineaceae bacterium]
MKDFFISYNSNDKMWAEWIAWTLEAAGYSTVIQAWDFRPGGNFVLEMQKAATNTRKTLAVLSQHYLDAAYTHPEWADALRRDPQGNERTLIPVRVGVCQPTGLLASVIYVDLVGRSVEEAQQMLLDALNDRAKPAQAPAFPGGGTPTDTTPRAVPPAPTASAGAGGSQGGGRGVSIGGNVSGSVIVTG